MRGKIFTLAIISMLLFCGILNLFPIWSIGELNLTENNSRNNQSDITFLKAYGGKELDKGCSVQQTQDGGYIICGYTESFGAGLYDVWLLKTNSFGNEEWNRTYGGSKYDKGYSVQQTSDEGYIITGSTRSYGSKDENIWLIKTDALGIEQWNKSYYWGLKGLSVLQTSNGEYIVTGNCYDKGYGEGIFLAKIDTNGNEIWIKKFIGHDMVMSESVIEDLDYGYVIVGWWFWESNEDYSDVWVIKTDSLGNEQWNKTYGGDYLDFGDSIYQTLDKGYIIVGDTESYGAGERDIWLIKINSKGFEQWNKTFGGSSSDYGYSVKQTLDGGYIIVGDTTSYSIGGSDVWLIKTDNYGNMEWYRTYGDIYGDSGESVQQTTDGGFIITGSSVTEDWHNDVWLIKTDALGNVEGCVPLNIDVEQKNGDDNPFWTWTTIIFIIFITILIIIFIIKVRRKKHLKEKEIP